MAKTQLQLFGVAHELVMIRTTTHYGVTKPNGVKMMTGKAGAYGYVKGGNAEKNNEAKALRLADALEVDNMIAEHGLKALTDLHAKGRIQFTSATDGIKTGSLSWKRITQKSVVVPASYTPEKVAAFLKSKGVDMTDDMFAKLKNVTPVTAPVA